MAWKPPEDDEVVASDWTPPESDDTLDANASKGSGSFLDHIAEMGRKGPLTVARESFSANPEPALDALPMIGGVAGGFVGGPAGAGAGAYLGEAARQAGSALTGTGEVPSTPIDSIYEMGKAGVLGAAGEKAGSLAVKALPFAAKVGKGAAKQYGKVAEFASNLKKSDVARLVDDPKAILPEFLGGSKSTAKAGKALKEAEKNAGFLPEGKVSDGKRLNAFAGQNNPFKGSDAVAGEYFERVAQGQKLTPDETFDAYQAAQEAVSKMTRENPRYVEMLEFKNALQWELKNVLDATGQYADATGDFARAALGRSTSNVLPRTNTGKVSLGRTAFANLVAPGAGLALSSPAFYGATTAATSAAAKGAAKAIENPLTRRVGFQEIVRRTRQKDKKK
jgi:hypothetical protein